MDNLNNISYADDWKKASNPVRYEKPETKQPDEQPKVKKKTKSGRPILTLIQIVICLLIVLSAYVLKLYGKSIYKEVKKFYDTEINNEIILNPYENSLDELINASKD